MPSPSAYDLRDPDYILKRSREIDREVLDRQLRQYEKDISNARRTEGTLNYHPQEQSQRDPQGGGETNDMKALSQKLDELSRKLAEMRKQYPMLFPLSPIERYAEEVRAKSRWPETVTLSEEITVPVMVAGRVAGTVKLNPGQVVKLVEVRENDLVIFALGAERTIPRKSVESFATSLTSPSAPQSERTTEMANTP